MVFNREELQKIVKSALDDKQTAEDSLKSILESWARAMTYAWSVGASKKMHDKAKKAESSCCFCWHEIANRSERAEVNERAKLDSNAVHLQDHEIDHLIEKAIEKVAYVWCEERDLDLLLQSKDVFDISWQEENEDEAEDEDEDEDEDEEEKEDLPLRNKYTPIEIVQAWHRSDTFVEVLSRLDKATSEELALHINTMRKEAKVPLKLMPDEDFSDDDEK